LRVERLSLSGAGARRRDGKTFAMYKIIGIDGQQYGPISADQVRRWLSENRANAHTLVQVEGTPDWKPLATFAEFAADLKAPPLTGTPLEGGARTSPPYLSGTNAVASAHPKAGSRIAAGICGILLGSLGIHKFILGYTGAGLIMLLVTLLTCFIASPIMHLIGLIEGIIYLTKSDAEFVKTYVENRREWF
jgi:TM2 domain-containing membrane protein YozV